MSANKEAWKLFIGTAVLAGIFALVLELLS
jgi:hypothetical protein